MLPPQPRLRNVGDAGAKQLVERIHAQCGNDDRDDPEAHNRDNREAHNRDDREAHDRDEHDRDDRDEHDGDDGDEYNRDEHGDGDGRRPKPKR